MRQVPDPKYSLVDRTPRLLSVAVIHDRYLLLLSMTGVGIAWESVLAMPYAMLAGSLPPEKVGVYMGIFNFFIVMPENYRLGRLRIGHEPSTWEQQDDGRGLRWLAPGARRRLGTTRAG